MILGVEAHGVIIALGIEHAALSTPVEGGVVVALEHVAAALGGRVGDDIETAVARPNGHTLETLGLQVIHLALFDQGSGLEYGLRGDHVHSANFIVRAPLAPNVCSQPGIIIILFHSVSLLCMMCLFQTYRFLRGLWRRKKYKSIPENF